jgi:nucleoside-diphosphate-sugar epimerase
MILVTGGAGFVGLNVVEQLLARGEEVFLYDLNAPPRGFPRPKNLTVAEGDSTDRGELKALFGRFAFDRVVHLAAITAGPERDAREPQRIVEVNVIGTLNVLEAARAASVKRFVHASTGALYGAAGVGVPEPLDEERHRPVPESMYGISKHAAERACLRLAALWKMDVMIGRLAMVFGRWEYSSGARDRLSLPTQIARFALERKEAIFPALPPTDYIYAADIARALILLLDAAAPKHRLYHLGNGAPWTLPRWCEALSRHFPGFRWREAARAEDGNMTALPAPGTRTAFSNRRLVEDFGYAPAFDVEAAASDFSAWLKSHEELP